MSDETSVVVLTSSQLWNGVKTSSHIRSDGLQCFSAVVIHPAEKNIYIKDVYAFKTFVYTWDGSMQSRCIRHGACRWFIFCVVMHHDTMALWHAKLGSIHCKVLKKEKRRKRDKPAYMVSIVHYWQLWNDAAKVSGMGISTMYRSELDGSQLLVIEWNNAGTCVCQSLCSSCLRSRYTEASNISVVEFI